MKNIQILDRQYHVLAFMSNDAENGLHYTQDKLTTSIEGGIYSLSFIAPKTSADVKHLREGHYITFLNNQNVRLLMEIKNITENRLQKSIVCQDVNINLINPYAEPSLAPQAPQTIDYYLNHAISTTGWEIGKQEFEEALILEYTSDQSILERIRDICSQFGAEFYFSVGEFESGQSPSFYINIVKKRLEGEEGFRISSDDYVQGVERQVNNDSVVTKMKVRGKAIEAETEVVADGVANVEVPPISSVDNEVEKVIAEAMRVRDMKLPYKWGGNDLKGFDCSGFVSWCFRTAKYAGYPTTGRPTTNSMWNGIHSSYFTKISRSEIKRGDILLWDTGYTFPGDQNHTGIALDNKQAIHSGNPNGIIQNIDSMKVTGCLRIKR